VPLYFPAQGDSSKCQESCSMWLLESHHVVSSSLLLHHLFLYVLRFSYVLSYGIAKVMLHWEGFCLLSVVPSSLLLRPCSVIYLRFIGEFLFAFFGLPFE